ncbi:MAG: DUF1801 domain-containing protein [Caldilineaceae bacterium]|nr:DUF1801 domain-containing protein [Caldilineaceae bacterium]
MAENKTQPTDESVEAFLDRVSDEKKRQDCLTLLKLMHEVTGQAPQMWGTSIVGFGRFHYRYASGREGEMPLIGFSPRKQNLTLYIMDGFDEYDRLLEKLGKHSTGKSCLYIKRLDDVDLPTLQRLIVESVKHMVESNP